MCPITVECTSSSSSSSSTWSSSDEQLAQSSLERCGGDPGVGFTGARSVGMNKTSPSVGSDTRTRS